MTAYTIVGVMGPGENANAEDERIAFEVGRIIAQLGYVVLTGGRNCGVMDAALKGAKKEKGLTLGILPGENTESMSDAVDIPILTGMGNARNVLNILSSKVIVAIGQGAGTFSEISLAIKTGRPLIALNIPVDTIKTFNTISPNNMHALKYFDARVFKDLLITAVNET